MPASPPTPEELLRLARKAWPEDALRFSASGDGDINRLYGCVEGKQYDVLRIDHNPPHSLQALHAALLVLAGELSIEPIGGGYKVTVSNAGRVELATKEDP